MSKDATKCPVCHADLLETFRLGVVVMGTGFTNMTLSKSAALALRKELPSLIPNSHSRPADAFISEMCYLPLERQCGFASAPSEHLRVMTIYTLFCLYAVGVFLLCICPCSFVFVFCSCALVFMCFVFLLP